MKPLFELMCDYNRWMNERLLEACSQLSDEALREDRGAWFKSLHGTWNHLLLTDRTWLGRFTNQPFAVQSLDEIVVDDWEEFKRERARTDADLAAWLKNVSEDQLQLPLTFRAISTPREFTMPLWMALAHLFNHQAHHRGQITQMMEEAGVDSGPTDLPVSPLAQVLAAQFQNADERSTLL